MFIITCASATGDVVKSYRDGSLVLFLDEGSNMFCPIRVDAVEVGHLICHEAKPGPSLEVTQVQEV